jgi:hypothetical protein
MRYIGIFGQTPLPNGGFDLLSCLTERLIGQADIPFECPKYQNSQGTKALSAVIVISSAVTNT